MYMYLLESTGFGNYITAHDRQPGILINKQENRQMRKQ
jgi:hypothetical protein